MPSRPGDFPAKTVQSLARRAAYRCSRCDKLTVARAESSSDAYQYIGVASHIHAAESGGPRFLETMTLEETKSIDNAIFLCRDCSVIVDNNGGADFTASSLKKMKSDHEGRIAAQFGQRTNDPTEFSVETSEDSSQEIRDTAIIADYVKFSATQGSLNQLDGVVVKSKSTTLKADKGSRNVVDRGHFDDGKGNGVSMHGLDLGGTVGTAGASIGIGADSAVGMGGAVMWTNNEGDLCFGFRNPVMTARCPKCAKEIELFRQPQTGERLTCPRCGFSALI